MVDYVTRYFHMAVSNNVYRVKQYTVISKSTQHAATQTTVVETIRRALFSRVRQVTALDCSIGDRQR